MSGAIAFGSAALVTALTLWAFPLPDWRAVAIGAAYVIGLVSGIGMGLVTFLRKAP